MSTIANKIQYTYDAVKDIKQALQEKGYPANITLKEVGDIIRRFNASSEDKTTISFANYNTIVNNSYYPMTTNTPLNISINTSIDFTNNIVKIEEEE